MQLHFTKMHGAGNDFIVVDATGQAVELSAEQWRRLADRRFGIGADQILIVGKPADPANDFSYRIINADGGEVEHCGNGARAFLRFVTDKGLTAKRSVRVEIRPGVIVLELRDDGDVTVEMGVPQLTPAQVPFDTAGLQPRREGAIRRQQFEAAIRARHGADCDVTLAAARRQAIDQRAALLALARLAQALTR